VHISNHAIDAIDATHWSIYAQVPEEEWGDVVAVDSSGKPGYVPGRFLNAEKTALLTQANDPARGLLFCNGCQKKQLPKKNEREDGTRGGYKCSVCNRPDFDMLVEPTGRWAI
jgi:hypothetical protein